jgi:HK97 family phage prohead protease
MIERRSFVDPVEFRGKAGALVASGVAMRYGAVSKPIRGQFREVFEAGAFAKTIQETDVRSHLEHGGPYLGRTGSGSLELTDDRSSLAFSLRLPDTTAGRDAAALLETRDVAGSSIGFTPVPARLAWSRSSDGMALRSVGEARLFVVDLTTSPAYDDSTADLAFRSLAVTSGMDYDAIVAAAERGALADMIDPPVSEVAPVAVDDTGEDEPSTDTESGDGRETPTVNRPHIAWLYV